jgi:nucleotide-binding universal stress UspA family protein
VFAARDSGVGVGPICAGDASASGPVLACVHDGDRGRAVARIGATLARRLEAPLVLATVQQPTPNTVPGEAGAPPRMPDGRSLLAGAARGLNPPAALCLASGEPSERLLALAQRAAAQLVVVSAPLRTPAETLLLGNVHMALARAASCPVVVVPPRVSVLDAAGPIVCGVDGSDRSSAIARVASDLADRLATRLILVPADVSLPAAAPDRLIAVAARVGAQVLVTGRRKQGETASGPQGSSTSTLAEAAAQPIVVVPAHSAPEAARRPRLPDP